MPSQRPIHWGRSLWMLTLGLSLAAAPTPARAESYSRPRLLGESTTGFGSGTFFQDLSLGTYSSDDHPTPFVWTGDYRFSKVNAEDGNDLTHTVGASIGKQGLWDFGGEISFSDTARENLQAFGAGLWVGRNISFSKSGAAKNSRQEDEDSGSSLEPLLHVHETLYRQSESPVTESGDAMSVRQTEVNLTLTWDVNDRLRLRVGQSVYAYSGDPNALVERLYTDRILDAGIGSSFEILGGFMKDATSAGAQLTFPHGWETQVNLTHGTSYLGGASSYDGELGVQKKVTRAFSVGVDFNRQLSKRDGNEDLVSVTLGLRF